MISEPKPQKSREWYVNPTAKYICEVNENGIGLTATEIHVIEIGAYSALKAKLAAVEDENAALIKAHDTQVIIAKEFQKLFIQVEPEMTDLTEQIERLTAELAQAKSDDAKTQLALDHVRGLLDEKTAELDKLT